MSVPQETLAERPRRQYHSPARRHRAERSRQALIEAALGFVRAGNFRPESVEIARKAGCSPSAIIRHFGAIDLLYRCLAREHAPVVVTAAGIEPSDVDMPAVRDLAWVIMVGRLRERS